MIWLLTFWCHATSPTLNPYCAILGRLATQEFETEERCVRFASEFLADQERLHRFDGGGPFAYEYSCSPSEPRLRKLPARRER
jgi:Zn-dependent peptidase ImmA (M78 family)